MKPHAYLSINHLQERLSLFSSPEPSSKRSICAAELLHRENDTISLACGGLRGPVLRSWRLFTEELDLESLV